ncbi:MAG: ECF RNA polymerase sigma factor SigE [Deltaproteobacteria bacterium ADurb.Bin151]|nr:MAG: ECF RNA polymerase sigma factor SigE [Deltaproteobacteria bacterium ADurb.Bin151]
MHNPFQEKIDEHENDVDYIQRALKGDAAALEALILRHQSWIFNIALNMTGDIHRAEDVTQEILIIIISKLATYDQKKASFRTWLYRIVANHVINMKQSRKEQFYAAHSEDFNFNSFILNLPENQKPASPDDKEIIDKTRNYCVLCILLCLNRMERIVLILGGIFDVTDRMGSEICDISQVNFRKILSRSRKKVADYFQKNCSLLDRRNPCKCSEQANYLANLGLIKPGDHQVTQSSLGTIRSVLGKTISDIEDSYSRFLMLYQEQPFFKGPDMAAWLRDLLRRNDVNEIFFEKN